MRAFLTTAILTVTVLTFNAPPAHAQPGAYADLVDSWYHRYLGRHVDPAGRHDHVQALRHGTPAYAVEAAILSSPEYYIRNGNTPEGYVAALHRDVLGRRAGSFEFSREVNQVFAQGRNAAAMHVLSERGIQAPRPIVVAPAPVVVVRPAPAYRPAPVYVAPAPAISFRFNFGR